MEVIKLLHVNGEIDTYPLFYQKRVMIVLLPSTHEF